MTSTTLDVCLCLLLVSASAVVVADTGGSIPDDRDDGRAVPTAKLLGTSTAAVRYDVPPPGGDDAAVTRRDRGTFAALLGRAAVREATIDRRALLPPSGRVDATGRAVRAAVGTDRTRVVAVWRPYPGSALAGRIAVGPSPPPGTTVHAATLAVPTRFPAVGDRARAAARRDGFAGVARVAARAVVRGLFPPNRTRYDLRDDGAAPALVRRRYRWVASALGVDADPGTAAARNVTAANRRLAAALATRIERELRGAFGSPAAAARAVDLRTARVVVRTWS